VIRMSILRASVFASMLIITCTAWVLAQSEKSQEENVVHVDVDGLHSNRGQVLCSLFSSAADFPKKADRAVAHAQSEISDKHASCEFQNVSPGIYAVSVFHDENSNGKLDTNFMGIPREGVGASNNAKGRFGPPKFSAAAFQHASGRTNLNICINYL
jgi:uncharacterized protein (DUF2141 family)